MSSSTSGSSRQLSLKAHLIIVITVVVVGLALLISVNLWGARQGQMNGLTGSLRSHVQAAIAVADVWRQRARNGDISAAEAQKKALEQIGELRWNDGQGYVYALDKDYVLVLNPISPDKLGTDVRGFVGPKGKQIFQDMYQADQRDGHAITYYYGPQPGVDHDVVKVAYSELYEPWGMHFASGMYMSAANSEFRRTVLAGVVGALVIGLIIIMLVWLTMRSIKKSVGGEPAHSAGLVNRMADGDLVIEGAKEMDLPPGSMMHAMQRLHKKMLEVLGQVQSGSRAVSVAARDIAESNNDLSRRTQDQAASLQETAASMEEMTATVKQNADNANQANRLADSAREQAAQGGEVVDQTIAAMSEISASSDKITEIVSMIDDIAFQTNLLALNASVEAARAGEHGRGFAVVASEVRNLSQRSADAAREIKSLIDESTERVNAGSKLVNQSGEALSGIVDSVRQVTEIVAEIAAASQEQSSGITQVNQAVAQMDEVTQQNASMVEKSATWAGTMQEQAAELQRKIAYFRISKEDDRSASTAQLAVPASRPATAVAQTSRQALPAAATGDDDWTEF